MGPEIQAKLGVDTSSVATDLAGAKNIFNKWGHEVASSGSEHGADFGGKLVKSIEHKIGGGHLGNALAAALGINIDKIADKIAEVIANGSKEGWEEAGKIADENAKLIREKLTDSLTPKQLASELDKELQKAVEKAASIKPGKIFEENAITGQIESRDDALNADQLKAQQEAQHEILEIEKKIRELKKDGSKDVNEYEEARKKIATEELSDGHKVEELSRKIAETTDEMLKGELSAGELAKKKLSILEMEHQIKEATLRISKEDGEAIKKNAEATEKAQKEELARSEKLFSLKRQEFTQGKKAEDDQNKLTDRSKLTVGELAKLQGGKKEFSLGKSNLDLSIGSNDGLTGDQVEARKKAQKIQELESEAEAKRLAGDASGSEQALGKVGQLRNELVSSGATKSTEGDKFSELQKQIAEDNKIIKHTLEEILKTEQGKFVSQ